MIERIIARFGHGSGLSQDQLADFRGTVHVKLMKDDYAVLRRFKGRSSLKTYLYSVIHRQFQDFLKQIWGGWQPSAKAAKIGQTAIALETLIVRDGHLFHEAAQILRLNQGVPISEKELERIYASLPRRTLRQMLDEGHLEQQEDPGNQPEAHLLSKERERGRERLHKMLQHVLDYLSVEDRFLVKMHFWDNATVARMAKTLGYNQKWLYRHLKKILKKLGQSLLEKGVLKKEILEYLNPPVC